MLNNSARFAGTVAGFATGDSIDVEDVKFIAGKDFYDPTSGLITVTDGTNTAKIQLLGQYMASDFDFASNGHGGTLITEHASASAATMLLAAHT